MLFFFSLFPCCVRACVCVFLHLCACVCVCVNLCARVSVALLAVLRVRPCIFVGDTPGALGEEQSQACFPDRPCRRGTLWLACWDHGGRGHCVSQSRGRQGECLGDASGDCCPVAPSLTVTSHAGIHTRCLYARVCVCIGRPRCWKSAVAAVAVVTPPTHVNCTSHL